VDGSNTCRINAAIVNNGKRNELSFIRAGMIPLYGMRVQKSFVTAKSAKNAKG